MFASIAGLVATRAIPLHLGVVVFEQKVASLLSLGNWWHVCDPSYRAKVDALYITHAKVLLGCEPWRYTLQRTRLGTQRYRSSVRSGCFTASKGLVVRAHNSEGPTWACSSLQLLHKWQILDWLQWRSDGSTFGVYKRMVKQTAARYCRSGGHCWPLSTWAISLISLFSRKAVRH